MTYRSLLVYLHNDPLAAPRTDAAIHLARHLDAHLVGLAPTGQVEMPVVMEPAVSLGELTALAWQTLRDQAAQSAQAFRDACQSAGLRSFEAVIDEADEAMSLVRHAHCSDLSILSQADPAAEGHRAVQRVVEQVLLQSARPTLVLPYVGKFRHPAESVLVAWDDSREAARAVSDALPLLRVARQVHVIYWRESVQDDFDTLPDRLGALERWLLYQGVQADVRSEGTSVGVADAILSRAADLSADLIVMGGYGHTRWTERVLGGATRGLLTSMTAPVLMSH